MGFLTFPFSVGRTGRLGQAESPEDSILQLLRIMAYTPQSGWAGSSVFGLSDVLIEQSKSDTRLFLVRQINEAFDDLGIDWVRAEEIQFEAGSQLHERVYAVTLLYAGRGRVTQRFSSFNQLADAKLE